VSIPLRYRRYFNYQPERRGYRQHHRCDEAWICKICGRAIRPNNAGAQSHVTKHVREGRDASFYVEDK